MKELLFPKTPGQDFKELDWERSEDPLKEDESTPYKELSWKTEDRGEITTC